MPEVEKAIKSGEKTLKDLKGQVRGWKTSVAEKDAVAVYETTGEKMQQKLTDMRGDVGNKHLEKVITPAGGHMGKLNELVLEMQVWLAEESKLGGSQIIEDRLIFAATNLAPLLRLRGRLIFEITAVHDLRARQTVAGHVREGEGVSEGRRGGKGGEGAEGGAHRAVHQAGGATGGGALPGDQGVARAAGSCGHILAGG